MANNESKGSEIPDKVRDLLLKAVDENYDELISAMMELAKGVVVQEITKDEYGNEIPGKVYKQKPDRDVAKYLMDQVIGKPKESMNIEGKINLVLDEDLDDGGEI